jgi:hypothetical protein
VRTTRIVGWTGTRPPEHWGAPPLTLAEVELIRRQLDDLGRGDVVVTGACLGVDELVMETAWRRGCSVVSYVPGSEPGLMTTPHLEKWSHEVIFTGKGALERNHDIVERSEIVRAVALYDGAPDSRTGLYHSRWQPRSGTWACIRMAQQAGKLQRLVMLRPRPAGTPPQLIEMVSGGGVPA